MRRMRPIRRGRLCWTKVSGHSAIRDVTDGAIELKLIHKALFDPYDQSLWYYHQNLLCTFDPARAKDTMAPDLTNAQRLEYLDREMEFIDEVLEDADDCKWVYQALIDCTVLKAETIGSSACWKVGGPRDIAAGVSLSLGERQRMLSTTQVHEYLINLPRA